MPDLDREVRREVERMARRVDTAKAFSGIMRRVRRRRLLRTLQKASIAAVVLAGTTLSVLGLLRMFGNPGVPGEGAGDRPGVVGGGAGGQAGDRASGNAGEAEDVHLRERLGQAGV